MGNDFKKPTNWSSLGRDERKEKLIEQGFDPDDLIDIERKEDDDKITNNPDNYGLWM